jgi:hypothetical protein
LTYHSTLSISNQKISPRCIEPRDRSTWKTFFTFAKTLGKSFCRYSYLEMDLNHWHKDFRWAKANQKFGFFYWGCSKISKWFCISKNNINYLQQIIQEVILQSNLKVPYYNTSFLYFDWAKLWMEDIDQSFLKIQNWWRNLIFELVKCKVA